MSKIGMASFDLPIAIPRTYPALSLKGQFPVKVLLTFFAGQAPDDGIMNVGANLPIVSTDGATLLLSIPSANQIGRVILMLHDGSFVATSLQEFGAFEVNELGLPE
jgi:hypothetical protein